MKFKARCNCGTMIILETLISEKLAWYQTSVVASLCACMKGTIRDANAEKIAQDCFAWVGLVRDPQWLN